MQIAFVFPGQGSQRVGMGRYFYDTYPEARDIFAQADQALGFSLTEMCFSGPEAELNKTINTQPAILTASVACLEVWKKAAPSLSPAVVAGHSLGEYSALVAAGSLTFADAVRLVRKRGQYMQEAVPIGTGGMAAVMGLSATAVQEICRKVSDAGVVEAVNLNCPGQVVVAGDNQGLAAAEKLTKEAGAKRFIPLNVSAPFHSSLMRPAGAKLALDLEQVAVADPELPVLANVTADFARTGPEVKELLVRQVYSPVRWEESVERVIAAGITMVIEIGPGRVLGGLVKKVNRKMQISNVEDAASLEKSLALVGEVG